MPSPEAEICSQAHPAPAHSASALFLALADVFAQEGRHGGDAAAAAFAEAANTIGNLTADPPCALDGEIRAALEGAEDPAAQAIRSLHGQLPWRTLQAPGSTLNAPGREIFAVAFLLGPGEMIESATLRGGLFFQRANTRYPLHSHAAEETYAPLIGDADWTDAATTRRRGPGSLVHHRSEMPHASTTHATPLLAAWRWSGDIRFDAYRLLETQR